jgi:DNA-binding NarL/FixJ family response regulator
MMLSAHAGDVNHESEVSKSVMSGYHIVIIDDHPLFRDALKQTLEESFSEIKISEGGTLDKVAAAIQSGVEVDLILLDLSMPGIHGYSGLMFLRAQHPEIPVVVVSANESPSVIQRCLEFGASGFIPKSLEVKRIREAVAAVLEGAVWWPADLKMEAGGDNASEIVARLASLTPQQVRVLMMLGEGLLNKQIAFQLGVSEATVKAHVSAILEKLGVDSRTQAVIAVNKIDAMELPKLAR